MAQEVVPPMANGGIAGGHSRMVGELVRLSAAGQKLKCCEHLRDRIGLVVDVCIEGRGQPDQCHKYWIRWIGLTADEAYPARRCGHGLANGMWNRRDFKKVKIIS